jgi:glycosyltransferase involved in cell wall biosynthesis
MRGLTPWIFLALKGLSHIESMGRLVRRLRKWQPGVIHFQWTPLAIIDRHFVPLFRRIAPTILTVHDSTPFNDNPRARLQRLDAIGIMNCFDQLIVHTAAARSRLLTHGIDATRVNVVPHGLLMDIDTTVIVDRDVLQQNEITLLLFGHIKPYKGVDVLLRAVAQLPETVRQRCTVRIAGRAKMPMEPLIELAAELGLKSQVIFDLRFIPEPEIRNLMARADILVFPYLQIDASGVLMLAIAAGRAIVASNIGLFGELLKDGVHGALVRPNEPSELAAALAPLIGDRGRLRNAEQAVRDLADDIPDWQKIARMTEAIYRRESERRSTCLQASGD